MSSFDIGYLGTLDYRPTTESECKRLNETILRDCEGQPIDWELFEAWRESVKPFLNSEDNKRKR